MRLQIKIFNSVNARLKSEPNPQFATITIVGINDTPEPRFIKNMQVLSSQRWSYQLHVSYIP